MAVYDREEDAPQVNLCGRKMKLLEVMRILERETDAEHALTANRIAARLEEKGFPHADRKGIYDDINVLNCFLKPGGGGGCKRPRIEKDEITFGYYLDNRPFSVADLKLIIDALLSSRFLSEAKTMELVGALESLCSVHQAKGLKRQIIVANRVKNMNANVLNNADHIHAAIDRDVCIRFRYFDYGVKMERLLRKKGAWYVVSPLALVYCDDNYYMVGYVPQENMVKNYRVDRMTSVSATDIPRTGKEHFTKEEQGQYQSYTFKMYSGKVQDVTLRFRNSMMNEVVSKLGRQPYARAVDDEHFEITVPVAVSPQFFAWVFGLGRYVRIVAPESVRQDMRRMLGKVASLYTETS